MIRSSRLILAAALAGSAACAQVTRKADVVAAGVVSPPKPAEDAIGSARQEADGTLVLDLRAEGPGGIVGHSQQRYAPGDKDYAMVARHLGPIPKGGSVLVKPFPE